MTPFLIHTSRAGRTVSRVPELLAVLIGLAGSRASALGRTELGPARGPGPVQSASAFKLSVERGIRDAPFELSISNDSGAPIGFTTDGSAPTPATAQVWKGSRKVTNTTVLRVAVFGEGDVVGASETHTYLFPKQIVRQTGAGFPAFWGQTNGRPVQASYEMNQEIVNDPKYRDMLESGLKSIPSVSVVMDKEDLFGSALGIYANPQQSGISWERACSIELIYADGRPGFQIDCGIRVQGGWNRRPEESPKHALRLVFNERYGQTRLRFPVFGENGGREFETLILRAGCNNTWLHWSGEERLRGDYIRDQWIRDTMGAMGHATARGLFVHLYLNGLYWGLYDLSERPSAPFVAAHFGGSPKDYDSRNGDHILQGSDAAWKNLMRVANAGVRSSRRYEVIETLLDVPEFIDYMLVNLYGANADWDRSSNWYAARRRKPPGQFQFFIWDAERTLESVDANIIDYDDDESPPRLFQKLRQNPEFRLAFAEHVQKQLFGNGALAPEAAGERFRGLARQIDQAIVLESARWGAYRRDVHPYKTGPFELYTRDDHWRPEINRLLRDYFPRRGAELLKQLQHAGLYP